MALSIFSMCIFVSKPTSVHGRCRLLVDVFSLCSGPQPPRRSPRLPSPPPFLPVSPLPRPAQRRRTRADVHGRARHGRDNLHYETCSDDRCMSQPFLSLRTPPQLPRRPTPALAAIGLLPGNGFEMAHWGGGRHADASDRSYSEAGRQRRGAAGGAAKQRPGGGSGWLNSAKGQRSSLNSTQCLASAILCWTPSCPMISTASFLLKLLHRCQNMSRRQGPPWTRQKTMVHHLCTILQLHDQLLQLRSQDRLGPKRRPPHCHWRSQHPWTRLQSIRC
ncbi:hypothetical protein U9M48_035594 [Paspalum notatum var. saurae]|uniref:Uncharacterized protein n=1 Tax=Paspalum notatum var. saurae TaxID=547442 RepID=A0AAQ3XA60_PASNO